MSVGSALAAISSSLVALVVLVVAFRVRLGLLGHLRDQSSLGLRTGVVQAFLAPLLKEVEHHVQLRRLPVEEGGMQFRAGEINEVWEGRSFY